MVYVPEHNPRRRRAPTPRPEYVVTQDGAIVAMLDAKYRDLWNNDLPRDMLYQLTIYALSQQSEGCAAILYPTLSTDAKPQVIEIREALRGDRRAQVVLRPVYLTHLEALIVASGARAERARERFARTLAFGV
jgi:5-methylcytosine-specific restriction enzyme subunit McrC